MTYIIDIIKSWHLYYYKKLIELIFLGLIELYIYSQIDKEEFFVAMRLIALAQNNMPFSAENIERNNPIQPLPQFNINLNMNNNNNN